MSYFDLEKIPWERSRIAGGKRIREWTIPRGSPFWQVWRTRNLRQMGYRVTKVNEQWVLIESQPAHLHDAEAAAIHDSIQRQSEGVDPELPPYLETGYQDVCKFYDRIRQETGQDFTYQLPSIKRLALAIQAHDGALDASDTGVGKTFVACSVNKVLNRSLFVVCPKALITPWQRAASAMEVEIDVVNYEKLRGGNTPWGTWTVSGRNKSFHFRSIDKNATLFVFDECHRMKDYRTLNCKLGLAALTDGFKVLALSATAADNPLHMKFIALLTGLIDHPSHYFAWMANNGVRPGKWGFDFVGGHSVLSKIHRQIFPSHGSRIRIADLGSLFPETRIISEPYDMGDKATREIQLAYKEMHDEITKLEARRLENPLAEASNKLVQILRARQRVELLKVPTLWQMVEDGLQENMSVIVSLNFDASIKALSKRLNTSNTMTGEDKAEVRQELIDRFNRDEEDLIVMNIKLALGIGFHGTSDARTRLVLISPTYSGIDMRQMLGRTPRAGGAYSIQKIVWAANTVEEQACKRVRERMQRVSIFNDNELDKNLTI